MASATYSGVNKLEDRCPTRTVPPSLSPSPPPSAGSSPVTALPQAARAGATVPAASRPSSERRRMEVVVMGFSSRTVRLRCREAGGAGHAGQTGGPAATARDRDRAASSPGRGGRSAAAPGQDELLRGGQDPGQQGADDADDHQAHVQLLRHEQLPGVPDQIAQALGGGAGELDRGDHHDGGAGGGAQAAEHEGQDRKSTRLNSSHVAISYAVFCLKKKMTQ